MQAAPNSMPLSFLVRLVATPRKPHSAHASYDASTRQAGGKAAICWYRGMMVVSLKTIMLHEPQQTAKQPHTHASLPAHRGMGLHAACRTAIHT